MIQLSQYDSSGNWQWSHGIAGARLNDYSRALHVDDFDNVYVGLSVSGRVDLDPSSTTVNNTHDGELDFIIAKYTTKGKYVSHFELTTPREEEAWAINQLPNGNLVVLGKYEDTLDVDPSTKRSTIKGNSNGSYFLTSDLTSLASRSLLSGVDHNYLRRWLTVR